MPCICLVSLTNNDFLAVMVLSDFGQKIKWYNTYKLVKFNSIPNRSGVLERVIQIRIVSQRGFPPFQVLGYYSGREAREEGRELVRSLKF